MSLGMAVIWGIVVGVVLFNMWFGWAVYFYAGKQTN